MLSNSRASGSQRSGEPGVGPPGDAGSAPSTTRECEPHIGAYLAAQRRLRGISREELSQLTRIPLRSIERLESGVFDQQGDGFVRGFVRTVALALGLDPHDTLARMSREPQSWESGSTLGHSGWVHSLLLLVALIGLLGSVGLVSLALRPDPEPEGSPLVQRKDPVRTLAEDLSGRSELGAELVPIVSMRRTADDVEAVPPAGEIGILEASASQAPHLEAAASAP